MMLEYSIANIKRNIQSPSLIEMIVYHVESVSSEYEKQA